jgi:hypothetical protein
MAGGGVAVSGLADLRVWVGGAPVTVRSGPTPVPGLVVAEIPRNAPRWAVIHEPSGLGVARADDPELALAVAIALGGILDWTQPASTLRAHPAIERAKDAALRAGGMRKGPVATEGQIAKIEAGGVP